MAKSKTSANYISTKKSSRKGTLSLHQKNESARKMEKSLTKSKNRAKQPIIVEVD